MTEFTPITAILGGVALGLSAALLLVANGRIAGISGILGNALWPARGEERPWRIAFLAGLPLGAAIVGALRGGLPVQMVASPVLLCVAGLLVGFGTRLGSGCTSGHGICGLSRGSKRSLAATAIFMGVGGATVFVVRHLLGGTA